MLPLDVELEEAMFELLATLSALVQPLRAHLKVRLHISLFNVHSAFIGARDLTLVDDLVQSHVGLKSPGKENVALGTLGWVVRKQLKASLADYGSAPLAVERFVGQFKANDAFQ